MTETRMPDKGSMPRTSVDSGSLSHEERLLQLRKEIGRRWGVPASSLMDVARGRSRQGSGVLSVGCSVVDELLPHGGLPRGRLVEISGGLSSGKTSLVASLVGSVLRNGERVAWVDPCKSFYAPSATRAGIPLERLLLVQPPKSWEVFRAGEHLIRSGAFALVVLDATNLPGRGVASPLFRLSRLAARHHTSIVMVTDHPERVSSLGSCVALRLCIERRSYFFEPEPRPPFDITGYRIEVHVGKTKFGGQKPPKLVSVRSAEGLAK